MASNTMPEAKYQKLAAEYSKLRAQASVLKKAVLEEQSKNSTLRDHLRQRETSLRRVEQEVDSLGFRNKQLEHRVAALQDELATREGRKRDKEPRKGSKDSAALREMSDNGSEHAQDALIFEELQKKIMENAQLTSLNDDKERELQIHVDRIASLEQTLEKRGLEHSEFEKRLRRDMDTLHSRNSELETKLVEAASMLGSEDALSVSGSDNTPLHNTHCNHNICAAPNTHSNDFVRIACLEKELAHWRAQFEIAKLSETFTSRSGNVQTDDICGCSTSAAGLTVLPSYAESKSAQRAREQLKEPPVTPSKEQLLHNAFSQEYEVLLHARCVAESRIGSYELECEHLQNCLADANDEVKAKEEHVQSMNRALQMLEEDLATTRVNYEEQISVLTEQVLSLSDQLAACK